MGTTMGKNSNNFLDALPTQGTLHVVMLGLDSAGKTTALYRLKFDQYLNTVPTIGFNCEKVQGTVGRAKGVQFLVWDVGGQEKLRPLWRSYTRCTDGILFVVDSVDVDRMEEAKIELMRTAKCPDNQGVPVLILANKQDLPGAKEPKELEKLLSLHELIYAGPVTTQIDTKKCVNAVNLANNCSSSNCFRKNTSNESSSSSSCTINFDECDKKKNTGSLTNNIITTGLTKELKPKNTENNVLKQTIQFKQHNKSEFFAATTTNATLATTTKKKANEHSNTNTNTNANTNAVAKNKSSAVISGVANLYCKGWHIQPACAITGEGLQEGLEILYEMILKRRKMNKTNKKKR